MRPRITSGKVTNSGTRRDEIGTLDGIPSEWNQIGKGQSAIWGPYIVYRTGKGREARVYEGLPGKYVSKVYDEDDRFK